MVLLRVMRSATVVMRINVGRLTCVVIGRHANSILANLAALVKVIYSVNLIMIQLFLIFS
jgi:hypothetical protein